MTMRPAQRAREASIRLAIDDRDVWRPITVLALVAVAIAVTMAVIGLPPIDLHMPPHYSGIMDPLCGGTRAVRLAVRGEWSASWMYNPLGIPLMLACAGLVARAGVGLVSGRWVTLHVNWTRRGKLIAAVIIAMLIVALEMNQQAHAELLMGP